MRRHLVVLICLLFSIAACRPQRETTQIRVTLRADGRERTFAYTVPVTVDEFLRDPKVDIQVNETDSVNPSPFTQISDGMLVTVVRVTEKSECTQTEIPYKQNTIPNEALKPGEQQVGQAGQNGILETCYRRTLRDGVESDRAKVSETEIVAPQDEIISVGPTGEVEPVPITGTIAYINNGNAWVMRGSSTAKRLLTTSSDLDSRSSTFSLSSDGRQLLFARKTTSAQGDNSFNQLWLISDVSQDKEPIALIPGDVLYADWIPGQENTICYSTGEATQAAPGWQAYNDLWQMRLDPATGGSLSVKAIVERSLGGLYGWWGTRFQWSPDGTKLAWAQADSVGLVDLTTGKLSAPLLTYPIFRTVADWSWRATISWSPDNDLFATTLHGAPVGRELPENSPAFNVAVADSTGSFNASIVNNAGIWSAPKYSPLLSTPDSEYPQGYIAYLRARDPFNSINGEYDLVVADRDGSNARAIFPKTGQPGLTGQQSIFQNQEFTWSPDGREIAFIYQGNLWVIDVESEVAHQLTLDSGASNPVWTR
ncbi:MAG: G5 domain-containing protein [Chloroflexota bacterium]